MQTLNMDPSEINQKKKVVQKKRGRSSRRRDEEEGLLEDDDEQPTNYSINKWAYLLISNINFWDELIDILSFVHGCHDLLSNFFDLSQIDVWVEYGLLEFWICKDLAPRGGDTWVTPALE